MELQGWLDEAWSCVCLARRDDFQGILLASLLAEGPARSDFFQPPPEAPFPDDQWENPQNRIGRVKFQILCKFTARTHAQLLLRV